GDCCQVGNYHQDSRDAPGENHAQARPAFPHRAHSLCYPPQDLHSAKRHRINSEPEVSRSFSRARTRLRKKRNLYQTRTRPARSGWHRKASVPDSRKLTRYPPVATHLRAGPRCYTSFSEPSTKENPAWLNTPIFFETSRWSFRPPWLADSWHGGCASRFFS